MYVCVHHTVHICKSDIGLASSPVFPVRLSGSVLFHHLVQPTLPPSSCVYFLVRYCLAQQVLEKYSNNKLSIIGYKLVIPPFSCSNCSQCSHFVDLEKGWLVVLDTLGCCLGILRMSYYTMSYPCEAIELDSDCINYICTLDSMTL